MKKVKMTVLKTTLDKGLAKKYVVEGLGICPMLLKEGQVFYANYALNLKGFAMRLGKQFINMFLRFLTVRKQNFFILEIRLENPVLQFTAVTTDFTL